AGVAAAVVCAPAWVEPVVSISDGIPTAPKRDIPANRGRLLAESPSLGPVQGRLYDFAGRIEFDDTRAGEQCQRRVTQRPGSPETRAVRAHFQERTRPAWRISRRKSAETISTVRHISYRRERTRWPRRSDSVASRCAEMLWPEGICKGAAADSGPSR